MSLIDKWGEKGTGTRPCMQPGMRQPLSGKLEAAAVTNNSPSMHHFALSVRGRGLQMGGNSKVTVLHLSGHRTLSQMQVETCT